MLRSPSNDLAYEIGLRNEVNSVAGTSWRLYYFKINSGDFFNTSQDLFNTKAMAITAVKDSGLATLSEVFEALNVRVRKIRHMNIIANTCAVLGRIISAKDLHAFTFTA